MFKFRIRSVALLCAAMAAGAATVQAQTPPPPDGARAAPRPQPPIDRRSPQQTFPGVVRSFLLTPAGDVSGLMLDDGTQVDVPPHLGAELSGVVRLRDRIEVTGLRAPGSPLVRAVVIKDQATAKVVRVDTTPMATPPDKAAQAPALAQMTVDGRIAALLYTPRGDIGGVVMQDGTQVRFPPPEASDRGLAVGKPLYARGFGTQGAQGRAMEATAIGSDAASAQAIFQPPHPGPGPGRDGGPQRRAEAGPGGPRPPTPPVGGEGPPRPPEPLDANRPALPDAVR